jgi:hypothetical protein
MATFQDLAQDNPNLRQQYDGWREQRVQNGEDPTDYQGFRQHVVALGAPDPGEQEIDDFVGDDFRLLTRSAIPSDRENRSRSKYRLTGG